MAALRAIKSVKLLGSDVMYARMVGEKQKMIQTNSKCQTIKATMAFSSLNEQLIDDDEAGGHPRSSCFAFFQQTCVPLSPLGGPTNSTTALIIGWPGSPGKPTSPWMP